MTLLLHYFLKNESEFYDQMRQGLVFLISMNYNLHAFYPYGYFNVYGHKSLKFR